MVSRKTTKLIKSLQQKKYRYQHRLFLVEGAKSVRELLMSNFSVKTLIATKVFLQQHQDLLGRQSFDSQPIETDEATLSSLGSFKNNNAALAIVTLPIVTSQGLTTQGYTIALDDIRDPGNLGTIIRIADWYGIPQIVCSSETTDAYAPKVVSASMGSFLRVKIAYGDLANFLSTASVPVYGAILDRGESVHRLSAQEKGGIILLGNESAGVQSNLTAFIDQYIHIPRYGQAESLNVGVAAAIICDNMMRLSNARSFGNRL